MFFKDSIDFVFYSLKDEVDLIKFKRTAYEFLINHGFPEPTILRIYDDDTPITGYKDDQVLSALQNSEFITLTIQDVEFQYSIMSHSEKECYFGVRCPYKLMEEIGVEELFRAFINEEYVTYAYVHDLEQKAKVIGRHYRKKRRTFNCNHLHWLTYFRGDELRKQGGEEAIIANPYITSYEKINDGLLLQVNESLEACLTPEGEERLINATDAMPPASWK